MGVIVKLRVSRVVRLFVCFVVCGKCRHLCFGIFVFSGFSGIWDTFRKFC